jgi:hypothetical protein
MFQAIRKNLSAVIFGALVVAAFFAATLWALDTLWPRDPMADGRPALAALPPLQPVTRTSVVIAPVAVANLALRDLLEAQAPRGLNGKRDNPLSDLLGKAEIGWTMARGPIAVAGVNSALNITTALNGSLRVTGQIANQGGNLTGAITGLLGDGVGRSVGNLTQRALDQRADIRGNVTVVARPALLANWRIDPNLAGSVALGDGGMNIAGIKLNVGNEVKPLLDRTVQEQISGLSARLRDDRTLELVARQQWARLCRSIPLGAVPGAPNLWLEMRPTKALAAQPRILPDWLILTVGVQAETRIVPEANKPACPFPAQLELVPALDDRGKVAIAVPIDMPFSELSRLLEAQLKGKTFPDDGRSPAEVTVLRGNIAASGDRLLVSLRVKARETKSWFGFGGEATVHVWGRPALDRGSQTMRLTDLSLDVESGGLLGTAARAAIPFLQAALEKHAAIDLKPFIASAKKSIEAAIADFQKPAEGVEVEAAVNELRLVGVEFDSKTLRVIAEADGAARALVRKLALQ